MSGSIICVKSIVKPDYSQKMMNMVLIINHLALDLHHISCCWFNHLNIHSTNQIISKQ